jgi:hypothetical protein
LTKYLGDDATIATQPPIKGKKSLVLVLFIYVLFFLLGLGTIPGIVDWAPMLIYLYLGQKKKIVTILVLRFFYFLGLVPQFLTLAIIVGLITGGVSTALSGALHVLWAVIMFVQLKGCLFDQIMLTLALNRGEEIKETEFAGQTGMALVTFGMINHKYACCPIKGKTSFFVKNH